MLSSVYLMRSDPGMALGSLTLEATRMHTAPRSWSCDFLIWQVHKNLSMRLMATQKTSGWDCFSWMIPSIQSATSFRCSGKISPRWTVLMKSGTVGANLCSFFNKFWRTRESLSWLGSLTAITVGGRDSALNESIMTDSGVCPLLRRVFSGVLLSSFKSKISSQIRLSSWADVNGLHIWEGRFEDTVPGLEVIIMVFVIMFTAIWMNVWLLFITTPFTTVNQSFLSFWWNRGFF